jgi:lysophospholipase L1-like esterase
MAGDRQLSIAFLTGAVTVTAMVLLVGALAVYRVGPGELADVGWRMLGRQHGGIAEELELSDLLLQELTALGAIVDNAGNPTGQSDHDNLLVRPDANRGWVLRPDASVQGHVLRARVPVNLDPPVLYLPPGALLSVALQSYLERETRLRFDYTVDAEGFRRTLPHVDSERRVLVVGDSVAFGVGVGDRDTLASALQTLVLDSLRVVNAGVGEYGPSQILATTEALSSDRDWEALIYVACQNDFQDDDPARHYLSPAQDMLERLAPLAPRFSNRVLVLLQTALDYTGHDVILDGAWPRGEFDPEWTRELRDGLPASARALGFEYRDWTHTVERASTDNRSLLYRFALYADHVHLSPLGNRLAAREIHAVLEEWGLVLGR